MRVSSRLIPIFAAAVLTGCAARPIVVNTECTNVTSVGGIFPMNELKQDFDCIARKDAALIIETGKKTGDVGMIALGLAYQRKLDGAVDDLADLTRQEVFKAMAMVAKPMDCEAVGTEIVDGKEHTVFGNCTPVSP